MDLQRDVRVFGGIGPGLLERHLVEGDLLGALAGHVLEVDGLAAEELQRHVVHVVARADGVEHVGLEHGVEAHAPQRDAGAGEHAHVVLQVLADLGLLRVFQDRLQRFEHLFLR